MSFQPNRSTPLPGEPFQAPQETAPPTPSAFLANQPGPGQFGGGTPIAVPAERPPVKKDRNWGLRLFMLMIVLSVVGGIGAAVYGVMRAKDAVDNAFDASDPELSGNDRSELGLDSDEPFLWVGEAPAAVAAALDNAIAGQPTGFLEISLYPDYAIATAQNPSLPDHFDRYTWRAANVDAGTPMPNDAAAATMAFSIEQMDWAALARVAADAVSISKVEQGEISHITVARDIFGDAPDLVARIYVSGPRSSAFVQIAADGTVIQVL
jgi:hypothetical protein